MIKTSSGSVSGSGSNGLYWRYDRTTGIKLSLQSNTETRMEGKWLKKLNKLVPGIFPQFKGFVTIDFDGVKCLAYKMEHIIGHTPRVDSFTAKQFEDLDTILAKLLDKDINFHDVDGNVLVTNSGSIRLIDADPDYFDYKGKAARGIYERNGRR